MKTFIIGAGSDLGVHIDGAHLGPIQLMNDIKSFYQEETFFVVHNEAIIKSRNLSDRRKNEYEIEKVNTEVYEKLKEKINEGVKDALNTLSANALSDNEIIEEYLKTIRPNIFRDDKIISAEYKKLSTPVKMRFLHEFIQMLELDYDYKKINELFDFIEANINQRNGSTKSLASALWLYADDKIIETIPPKVKSEVVDLKQEVLIAGEGEYKIGDKTLSIKKYVDKDIFVFPEATSNFAYVDLSEVKFPLILRTRHDGDVIRPFGMTGSMKLKKYMNAKGVAKHNRDGILLLCSEEEVLWVLGVGLSSKIGVRTKPTHVLEVI